MACPFTQKGQAWVEVELPSRRAGSAPSFFVYPTLLTLGFFL